MDSKGHYKGQGLTGQGSKATIKKKFLHPQVTKLLAPTLI
jgi:hypothetical protein